MKYRHYYFVVLIFLPITIIYGQQAIPVDLLTGRPQVNIPLFSVREGSLGASVGVSYSTSGAKPDNVGGPVGEGWWLQAGGAVQRVLHGLPDDMGQVNGRQGWLYASVAQDVGNWQPEPIVANATNEETNWSALNGFANYYKDTEPDEFIFSAPGLGGKFIFGHDKQPRLVPYQDVDIQITYSGSEIAKIIITNNLGVVYTFDKISKTTKETRLPAGVGSPKYFKTEAGLYALPITYNSSWKLSSVKGVAGEEINFLYEGSPLSVRKKDVVVIDETGNIDSLYYLKETYSNSLRLIRIQTKSLFIDLAWGEGLLHKVVLSNSGSTLNQREYHFDYTYHKNVNDNTAGKVAKKVAFLQSITELLECSPLPSYTFSYANVYVGNDFNSTTTTLPVNDPAAGRDIWGYYTSAASSKVPELYINANGQAAERYRVQPVNGQAAPDLPGENRDANTVTIYAGALTQITFPTGGTAFIHYEPNSYFDTEANRDIYGEGIRVRETRFGSGSSRIVTTYQYTDGNGNSSGKILYPAVLAFAAFDRVVRLPDNASPQPGVIYSRVSKIKEGQGKTVYTYSIPATYPATNYNDWAATMVRYAREALTSGQVSLGDSPATSLRHGYYQFPFPPNTNYGFARGQLLRVEQYNETGNLISRKAYAYQRLNTGKEVTVEGLKYEKLKSLNNEDVYMFGKYKTLANEASVLVTERTAVVSEMDNLDTLITSVAYTYKANGQIATTTTANSDGTVYTTEYTYAGDFSFSGEPAGRYAKGIYFLNSLNRHGTVIETRQVADDGVAEVTGSSLVLYDNFNGYYLPAQTLVSAGGAGFQPAALTGNGLTYDGSYEVTGKIEQYGDYGVNGLIEKMSDGKHNIVGFHYSYGFGFPLVKIAGAGAKDVVYESFEHSTNYGLYPSSGNAPQAWIGKAFNLLASQPITSTHSTEKGNDRYIVSCWLKGSATTRVTVKVTQGAYTVSGAFDYTGNDLNQWKYVETTLDMATIGNGYTVEVSTDNDILIDEFIFYPADATISITSFKPLVGKIAQTNGKGQSVFYTYDEKRRVKFIKNQDKDIIQYNEYQTYYDDSPKVSASFRQTSSAAIMGQTVSFRANGNCLDNVSYAWEVVKKENGANVTVGTGSGDSFFFVPEENRYYYVILTATHASFGSAVAQKKVDIEPGDITFFLDVNDPNPIYACSENTSRVYTVQYALGADGCIQNEYYTWYYEYNNNGWQGIGYSGSSLTFTPNPTAYGTYVIKCVVNGDCAEVDEPHYSDPVTGTAFSATVDYINDAPCQ